MYFSKFPAGLLFLWFLFPGFLSGQNTFQARYDDDSVSIWASGVLATADGYVLCGTADYHPFLMKMSPNGSVVWLKKYGNGDIGSNGLTFSTVIHANGGGFLAVGTSWGIDTPWNGEMLIVKTDADGNVQWTKIIPSYQTNSRNLGLSVIAVDNGYVISGESHKNVSKAALVRINNQGQPLWSKLYSTGLILDMVAGFASGDTIFAAGRRDSTACFGTFDLETGAPLFTLLFNGPASDNKSLNFIVPASNGDLLLSGYVTVTLAGTQTASNQWICRISRTGVVKWSKTYSGVGLGRIAPLMNDHFLLLSEPSPGAETDPILMKIDGDGEIVWCYSYGIAGRDAFSGAIETPDGGVLAVGGTEGSGFAQLLAVKAGSNGLVDGCCRQPVATVATPFPVVRSPQALNQAAFDNPLNANLPQQDALVTALHYCPQPQILLNVPILLCPGDSVTIDGTAYTGAGTVTSIVQGIECDTTVVYDIQTGVNPALQKTITFCPGDSVTIDGTTFTQPATFIRTVPSADGACDTLITYVLEYATPPAPTTVSLTCPADLFVSVPPGTLSAPVMYAEPMVQVPAPAPGSSEGWLLQEE